MSIKVEVWGDYACFSRPELKSEKYSYDVMTPSAARGILEAVFWHPGLRWVIDEIYVLSPIEFTNIRRNEVKSRLLSSKAKSAMSGNDVDLYIDAKADIQQRAATVLKNVHYVIKAHFDMTDKASETDNPAKFQEMMKRRLEKGQYYHQPYLGCREFPARFRLWEFDTVPTVNITTDLGLMLYDMDYSDKENITPVFFRARLHNGVLDLKDCEVFR
ncbi:MAG: type I-C CRISPR-associated protein Cas5c [Acutalibacteraceae bacterium]